MSAITGIYHLDQRPVDRNLLGAMTDRLQHRGVDAGGIWADAHIGLGNRLLWTTPEALLEQLPAKQHDYVITADARIDNRDELIEQLGLRDRATDSDLIVAAYRKWGQDCPIHLLGDFAFAIWDQQQQTLFCARDPMGVRPFYYYLAPQKLFTFASEIKALFCLPQVPRQVNELQIALYLMRDFNDREITFYENIFRLPAAHSLTISPRQFRLHRYWSLDPDRELKLESNQAYAEAYREIFNQAVRCRLRSTGPVGSMLSGGLDSSSIACTARNLLDGEPLHTFSAIFPEIDADQRNQIDERFYVEKVLDQGGFTPHFVPCDRLNPLEQYDLLLEQLDECFCAPNLYLNWAWFEQVQASKVRVLLDGIDGDTTISHGQHYLTDLVRSGQWIQFLRQARAYANRMGLPLAQVLWNWGAQSLIPGGVWLKWGQLQEALNPSWKQAGIQPKVAHRLKLSQHCRKVLRQQLEVPINTARQFHWHGLNSGLLQYGLELSDKTAAAFSVEPRYPFCDRRLMEFCLAIPADQKFFQGWSRLVARRAMTGILPPDLQTRTSKANLGVSFKANVLKYEQQQVRNLMDAAQPDARLITRYLKPSTLTPACQTWLAQPQAEAPAMTVYTAMTLARWLQSQPL